MIAPRLHSHLYLPKRTTVLRLISLVVLLLAAALVDRPATAEDRTVADRRRAQFQDKRQSMLLSLRHELSELSQRCHDRGLTQAAQDLTAISLELTTPGDNFRLPQMAQLPLSDRLYEEDRLWRTRLQKLREDKAQDLYVLARRAISEARLPTLAYQMIKDTLRLNPDHKYARKILGQQLFHDAARNDDPGYAGEWVSAFVVRQRSGSNPQVDHPEFGWIPVRHVEKYEQGQRPWRSGWVSIGKEAELRRDFQNAWEIPSEHFLVRTNVSLEEGVQVSRKLESFHHWLTTNFAAFFETPKALAERFAQLRSRGTRPPKPMEVHYYATREEYDRRIRTKSEILAQVVTNGLYWEPDRTCYFFKNPNDEHMVTVFHEATHQIFDIATMTDRVTASRRRQSVLRERQRRDWIMCEKANFWILEGIACYFESVAVDGDEISVGDPSNDRFVAAQHRLLRDNFYVPLQVFSGLGKEEFQQHRNLPQLYSQASGLAHFLMHYRDGMYRDDLVSLLAAVYRPDLSDVTAVPSLEEITGVKFAVLDQQYRDHMSNIRIQAGQAAQVQMPIPR